MDARSEPKVATRRRAGAGAIDRGLDIEIVGLLTVLGALGIGYLALTRVDGTASYIAIGVALALVAVGQARVQVGQRWQRGGGGEKRVGKLLEELEREGWLVEHDLMKPTGGNIDHVVVGPGGVFAVEVKLNRFGEGGLTQAGSHARYLRDRLGVPVQPIICLAQSKMELKTYGDVPALGARHLLAYLRAQVGPPAPTTPEFVAALRALREVKPLDSAKPDAETASTGLGLPPKQSAGGRGKTRPRGRWIRARFDGRCRRCNGTVFRGDRVWHDRVQRAVWCAACAPR